MEFYHKIVEREYVQAVLFDGTYASEEEVYKLFMKSNVVANVSSSSDSKFRELTNKLIDIISCLHKGTYFVLHENGDFVGMSESLFKNEGFTRDDSVVDSVKLTGKNIHFIKKSNRKKKKKDICL